MLPLVALLLVTQGILAQVPTKAPCVVKSADIAIILDASGSVDNIEWKEEVNFAKAIVNSFDIGPTAVRVGLIQYSAAARLEFNFNTYTTSTAVIGGFNKMVKKSGGTQTDAALIMARSNLFTAAAGDRAGVPNIAFVMTDGVSNTPAATIKQAQLLKQAGVTVFAVGVGKGAKMTELEAIATDKKKVYTFVDFNKLKELKNSFAQEACKVAVKLATTPIPVPTKVRPAQGCTKNPADIVFAVDTSTSVGAENFKLTRQFLLNMMELFDFSQIRVGVIKFNDAVTTEFTLSANNDLKSAQNAITAMKYNPGSGTVISKAITHLREKSFTLAEGGRTNVPNIGIVVTDGQAKDAYRTYFEAKELTTAGFSTLMVHEQFSSSKTKALGTTLFSIGIGDQINQQELENLASTPSANYVHIVKSFQTLDAIKAVLATQLCRGYTLRPSTTAAPKVCKDAIDCKGYDRQDVCTKSSYRTWAKKNCPVYCDLCPAGSIEILPTSLPCVDKIPNCAAFPTACTDPNFDQWRNTNCRKHCNLCLTTPRWTQAPTTPTTTTTPKPTVRTTQGVIIPTKPTPFVPLDPLCYDKNRKCKGFGKDYCKLPQYFDFMLENCQLFCGFCIPSVTAPPEICQDDPGTDCSKYDDYVCYDKSYIDWAKDKCRMRCGYCPGGTPPTPQPKSVCKDLKDCTGFGGDVCTDYKDWAEINCRAHCGICTSGPTTKGICLDKRDCSGYNKDEMCVLPDYRLFARGNCKLTCNLCDE